MKFTVKNTVVSGHNFLRNLGYSPQPNGSYARRVSRSSFPRYHAYIEDQDDSIVISLHLDQKKACYDGQKAHSGEYDSKLVQQEKMRILQNQE